MGVLPHSCGTGGLSEDSHHNVTWSIRLPLHAPWVAKGSSTIPEVHRSTAHFRLCMHWWYLCFQYVGIRAARAPPHSPSTPQGVRYFYQHLWMYPWSFVYRISGSVSWQWSHFIATDHSQYNSWSIKATIFQESPSFLAYRQLPLPIHTQYFRGLRTT